MKEAAAGMSSRAGGLSRAPGAREGPPGCCQGGGEDPFSAQAPVESSSHTYLLASFLRSRNPAEGGYTHPVPFHQSLLTSRCAGRLLCPSHPTLAPGHLSRPAGLAFRHDCSSAVGKTRSALTRL